MATQKININKKLRDEFSFQAKLVVFITREKPGMYGCYCPALQLSSQGDTYKEAKENIAEAVGLFIESCYERGVLARVLAKYGFCVANGDAPAARKKAARKRPPAPAGARVAHIPVFIPICAA